MGWVGVICWCVVNCIVDYSVRVSTCTVVFSRTDFIRAGLGRRHGAGATIARNMTQAKKLLGDWNWVVIVVVAIAL